MPLNFPASPTDGQTYADGGKVYVWNNTKGVWLRAATGTEGPPGMQGTTGTQGTQGVQGVQGTLGLQGNAGTSVRILGEYANLAAIQAAHPTGEPGDAYLVTNGDLYVWVANTSSWTNVGNIEGPEGVQGTQGVIGPQGTTGTQGLTGLQGEVGAQGIQGTTGTQGFIGLQGTTGLQGELGIQGLTGAQGSTGTQGLTGFQGTTGADANFNVIDAAGDLLVGSADNTVGRLALGSNGTVLTVDTAGAGVNKVKWAAAPDPIPSQTGNANRLLTTNGTSTSWTNTLTNLIQLAPEERFNVVASAATGSINIDFLTAAIWYYTTNASANHTINFRGNASNTLNAMLATGDAITVGWIINNGTTAYYPTTIQIDGSGVTPNWLNGSAPPASAQANQTAGIDAFTFTIIKTAATPTYRVLGSWAQYR